MLERNTENKLLISKTDFSFFQPFLGKSANAKHKAENKSPSGGKTKMDVEKEIMKEVEGIDK